MKAVSAVRQLGRLQASLIFLERPFYRRKDGGFLAGVCGLPAGVGALPARVDVPLAGVGALPARVCGLPARVGVPLAGVGGLSAGVCGLPAGVGGLPAAGGGAGFRFASLQDDVVDGGKAAIEFNRSDPQSS